jgi:hypothetical protein
VVFETQRTAIITKLQNGDYDGAKTDLQALIIQFESHYQTLNNAQKRRFDKARGELPHILEHLDFAISNLSSRISQRDNCIKIFNLLVDI